MATLNESNIYAPIMSQPPNKPFGSRISATCVRCHSKPCRLSSHTARLNQTSRVEVSSSNSDSNKTTSYTKMSYSSESMSTQDTQIPVSSRASNESSFFDQLYSNDVVFKSTSNANYILSLVRKLAGYSRMFEEDKKAARGQVLNGLSIDIIRMLCADVVEIFLMERRVAKISSPCYVMGDIHGNINDLLNYEEQFWPTGPALLGPNLLFLGDYVDRGEFSIEVACYLFALKILNPSKMFMLRGNHEVRSVQRNFTFEKECIDKYGSNGLKVFELLNNVFDSLPFSGIIDESIFCVHGGIPFTQIKIEQLLRVPQSISEPEHEAPAVWEVNSLTMTNQTRTNLYPLSHTDSLVRSNNGRRVRRIECFREEQRPKWVLAQRQTIHSILLQREGHGQLLENEWPESRDKGPRGDHLWLQVQSRRQSDHSFQLLQLLQPTQSGSRYPGWGLRKTGTNQSDFGGQLMVGFFVDPVGPWDTFRMWTLAGLGNRCMRAFSLQLCKQSNVLFSLSISLPYIPRRLIYPQ